MSSFYGYLAALILTFPIGWLSIPPGLEYVFILNSSCFAKSKMSKQVDCTERLALYPNVKILDLLSSSSLPNHAGQKFWGSRSHDQLVIDVPPIPWTKTTSIKGSGPAWMGLIPRRSSGRRPSDDWAPLEEHPTVVKACRNSFLPADPDKGGEGASRDTDSKGSRSSRALTKTPSSLSVAHVLSQSMPASFSFRGCCRLPILRS